MKKKIKEVFNSPTCKKWAKKLKEMYEDEYCADFWDAFVFAYGLHHKQNLAKPVRVVGKKKGKKR